MTIEARKPPPQFIFRLKRALGGRAGWTGFALQILFVAALVWIGYEIVANARANLQAQRITSGFGFLNNTAGFDVSQSLIPYSGSDTYTRVFLVGLLNTLLVSIIGIFFATVIGFLVALGRLSPNWLLSRISGGYVELVRNLPPLFQILFWYKAVLSALPNPRQSYSFFDSFFLSNRGLVVPKGIAAPGLEPFLIAAAIAIVAAFVLRRYARKELFEKGHKITIWPYVLGLLVGLPVMAVLIFGIPFTLEFPTLRGFNFSGGARVIPEFVALTLALMIFIKRSYFGKAIRATVQDRDAAMLMGINVPRLFLLTFAGGSALVGLAGCIMVPLYSTFPTVGLNFVLIAYVIVVLGGNHKAWARAARRCSASVSAVIFPLHHVWSTFR
jgi:general L-amino acid transport system permease protein